MHLLSISNVEETLFPQTHLTYGIVYTKLSFSLPSQCGMNWEYTMAIPSILEA